MGSPGPQESYGPVWLGTEGCVLSSQLAQAKMSRALAWLATAFHQTLLPHSPGRESWTMVPPPPPWCPHRGVSPHSKVLCRVTAWAACRGHSIMNPQKCRLGLWAGWHQRVALHLPVGSGRDRSGTEWRVLIFQKRQEIQISFVHRNLLISKLASEQ